MGSPDGGKSLSWGENEEQSSERNVNVEHIGTENNPVWMEYKIDQGL